MAKVLFINPVIRQNDKPRHIPYGMSQLVAIAIQEGHKVQVLDANAWRPSEKEMADAIASDTWDVIATGGLITTYGYIKKTVCMAKKIKPSALIIAGGGFITPIPHEVMTYLPEIDIGVIGEAYVTIVEILRRVDTRLSDWHNLRGIIYRKNGELVLNQEAELLENIDSLPFPAWDLFPTEVYFENSSLLLSEEAMLAKRHLGIVASYGCPFKCKYCFHLGLSGELRTEDRSGKRHVMLSSHRKIRYHSPEYVVDLVAYARDKFGVDFVSILDENFAALAKRAEWFEAFSDLWMQKGLQPNCISNNTRHDPESCKGVHWGTTAHAAVVTVDMLKKFKDLGCAHLDYGFESFSDDILKQIGKGATVKQNEEALKMTMRSGIRPIPNQIIGFPDESMESIFASLDAWERLSIQSSPFFATPYPGSEWYFTYKDRILEQYHGNLEEFLLDLGDATKITAVISKNFNAIELLGLRDLMVEKNKRLLSAYQKMRTSRS